MTDKICGIYLIENKINHHKYVGQSIDINARWKNHIKKSKQQTDREYDKPLYRAFRKYGIENFNFSILEECSKEELNKREVYWIKELKTLTIENGYNVLSNFQPELTTYGEFHPKHKLTKKDVVDIRTRYNNKERCKEVWKLYQNKVGWSGFSKVWKGETWKQVMMEVYTLENKEFHKCNTGQSGSENGRSLLNEDDVYNIRLKKKQGKSRKEVFTEYQSRGLKQGGFDSVWYGYTWKNIVV